MSNSIEIKLPWPPTVNSYWRHIVIPTKRGKPRSATILSEDARKYRKAVADCVHEQGARNLGTSRLSVKIGAFPPDRRARDLDNLPKGILDSLKHAGVIRDDADIDELLIVRGTIRSQGQIEVIIREMEFSLQ